ncbi:non-ribosomal peptide synthetase [Actinocrispum wychmicini]|uniref:Amino acid adenylation domain-containing protein n=1 Tax=Actinocrispum wychmicini TaxID=1213861 RepID=A0A4R2IIP7_9PSEU|nr:non-ribosomal peptide synthetase [Actinocrispum wychmicini]TCO44753.1 amino acid adenylation domain-containing protein [Actinocrispum wychmicini]
MFSRAVSPSEWWFVGHPKSATPVVQLVVEGDGEITLPDLAHAVAVASEACPGARLSRVDRTWVDSGKAPRVRQVPKGDLTTMAATHRPIDGCEVLLLPGAVVFRAAHAVMDGHGVLTWATDVFRVLRGEQPEGATSTMTETDLLDRLGVTNNETRPPLECPSPLGQPQRTWRRRTLWRRLTIDGTHPALVAKVATALTAIYGLETAHYAIAVDLRRHTPEELSTANLSQSTVYEVHSSDQWDGVHERLLRALAEKRELSGRVDPAILKMPVPVMRALIKVLDVRSARRNRYAATSTLSHLGRVDLNTLSTPSFHAFTVYSLSTLSTAGPPEVNMVECAGRTEITLVWCDEPGMAARADDVLAWLRDTLSPNTEWEGNDTARPARTGTVVSAFREQAARTPAAIALRWPDGEMTYAELDRRSSFVAGELRSRGAGRDVVVGVLADRSPETVTALWGVLKSGAAYLPLDPAHPDARINELLADAKALMCVTRRTDQERPHGCPTVVIDDIEFENDTDVPEVDAGSLAYVIYTSGSTGRPKGVEIEHGSLVNYTRWAADRLGVDSDSCFGLFTSLAFDLPNTALYLPLLAGGTLVLVADEPNHVSLRYLVEESGVNSLKLTPSHLDLILRLGLAPRGFRLLVVGGEQLRQDLAAEARRVFGCRVVNHYGPTEATVGCLAHEYDPEQDTDPAVPIGRPADNTAAYLLDPQRRFVSPGEAGELYVGGAQVARGYRGRPDLDRERFVRMADGRRVYRTGDLARLLPTGEVEYLGRADDQVKVLGHRVEPAEVARVLEDHPGVTRAVVVPRRNSLHAYAVSTVDGDVLRAFLTERLPRYLVPAAVIVVPEIPQTANGKVDVRALPDLVIQEATAERDDVGEAVAAVWADTLSVDMGRLDDDADFHRLGGDSVLLLSMLAGVCRDVVGSDGEQAFMAELGQMIREPTLERVSAVARKVLAHPES